MFAALCEAIDELDPAAEHETIVALVRELDRLTARVATTVAEFDREQRWALDGARSMHGWLAAHCRMAHDDARRLASLAARLRSLPATSAAMASGALSAGQGRAITANLSDGTTGLFAASEASMISVLEPLSVKDVSTAMTAWQHHAVTALGLETNPDEPERTLGLSSLPGGRALLRGELDAEGHATVAAAINHALSLPGKDNPLPIGRRRADALVGIARWYLDNHDGDARTRRRPHVDVIVNWEQLVSGGTGVTPDGVTLDPTTIAKLLCDCEISRVITDGKSAILDYGRAERTAPPELRQALVVRDRHCRMPGCDAIPSWLQAHHINDFALDGETRIEEMVMLCDRDHHTVHQPGWHCELLPDGTFIVKTPEGRVLVSHPPPLHPTPPA